MYMLHHQSIQNAESPFTELFSSLNGVSNSDRIAKLANNELTLIQQHVENAINVLLQGLQDLGLLLGIAVQDNNGIINHLNNIGCFISGTANLIEALNLLRLDIDYLLNNIE